MNRVIYSCAFLFIFFSCQQKPSSEEISGLLPQQLVEGDSLLNEVYEANEHQPFWVKPGGLNKGGEEFIEGLEALTADGLSKEDYWNEEQEALLEQVERSEDLSVYAQLDIAVSKAFLQVASDLNRGKINPSALDIEWKMDQKAPSADYYQLMENLSSGTSFENVLDKLRPSNPLYDNLRHLYQSLKTEDIEDAGHVAPIDGKIEKGDDHEAIPLIRKKLAVLKDLDQVEEGSSTTYDQALFEAVKRFQARHGLIDDGVIGADFIKAINYSHQDLLAKVQINMERLRWMPEFDKNENNKVIVNIPDYHLFYIQDEDTVLTSKVVVGKEYRQTPVFRAEMSYLVFSPSWTLPETILWEDAIPAIQKDRGYLAKNNMIVVDYQGNEVNPRRINWRELREAKDFPYAIRQAPGKDNPLGKVKFMFPNDHSIYIHDSPAQYLFSRDDRTFSSGCIRMEKPREFAAILLEGTDWDEEKLMEAMNQEEEDTVNLEEPQDVWILYLTTWGDQKGIEVREDVYGMDRKLAEALSLPISEYFL